MAVYLLNKHLLNTSRSCVWWFEYTVWSQETQSQRKKEKWQLQTTGQCDQHEKLDIPNKKEEESA